jgi:hypothetical protein
MLGQAAANASTGILLLTHPGGGSMDAVTVGGVFGAQVTVLQADEAA